MNPTAKSEYKHIEKVVLNVLVSNVAKHALKIKYVVSHNLLKRQVVVQESSYINAVSLQH